MSAAGELVREMRLRRTMSQRELAELAGTRQAAISRIERGLVSPSVDTLERIVGRMGERLVMSTEARDSAQSAGLSRLDRSMRITDGEGRPHSAVYLALTTARPAS